jgi:hypothetical protein
MSDNWTLTTKVTAIDSKGNQVVCKEQTTERLGDRSPREDGAEN